MKKLFGTLNAYEKINNLTIIRAVKNGLVNLIPVLTIGAFALILKTFPVDAYQNGIATFANGFFLDFLDMIYSATFGMLSVYMTFSISRSYMKIIGDPDVVNGGAVVASLLSFFILTGTNLSTFSTDSTGPKSMFLAILTGLGASALYLAFCRLFKKSHTKLLSPGADRDFNRMLASFFPIALVAAIFALVNVIVTRLFDVDSFRNLIAQAMNDLFSHIGSGFFKGFFFVLLSSVLWFFGIHGSDTLEGAMQANFAPGLAANQAAIAAGNAPTEILTKEFFDCFVLMGGCGAAICLLISIVFFSKNKARRGLGFAAAFPMIFNINELMVFGLPIILNPVMLIPFLSVPLVCYTITYIAISSGIVPMITNEVAWTTPIVLGGYTATGSAAGAILQVVNVIAGVLIYLPFVKILDRKSEIIMKQNFESFVEHFKENEEELTNVRLTDQPNDFGDFAKGLCAELSQGLKRKTVLDYQPQYWYDGSCFGVEALLRWKHPVHGIIYPPLVIKLADEGGFLDELEELVMLQALEDRDKIIDKYGKDIHISVNVTGKTVITPRYIAFCHRLKSEGKLDGSICLEVTEHDTLALDEVTRFALTSLKNIGLMLAIDDFSMGQTSVNYLKENLFDIIKLDGSLVRGITSNNNCREITSSITSLAHTLDMIVVAEYVEEEEQKEVLHEIGCNCYQGFLYSKAIPIEK